MTDVTSNGGLLGRLGRRPVLALLVVLAVVQISVPAAMIWSRERILAEGDVLKLRTAPVDPYDAFRGRYVALDFEQGEFEAAAETELDPGQEVFVVFDEDGEGFARIRELRSQRPTEGLYVKATVWWVTPEGAVRLSYPFARFYMEEDLAPAAERAYLEHSRQGAVDAYVLLRVRRGVAVIEDLYVADLPIVEYLEREASDGR